MDVVGRRALVTGASRGIGRAVAERFAAAGMEVYGTSRAPEKVAWAAGIKPLMLDVSTPESVEEGWKRQGLSDLGFSLVVNNAGAGAFADFRKADFEVWRSQLELLLLSPMKLSQLAMANWTPEDPGLLINVSSLAVEYPIPYMSGYNAGKAGLSAFSESLLLDASSGSFRVIDLRVGDVNTGFNSSMTKGWMDGRMKKVWSVIENRFSASPKPESVADELLEAVLRDRVGTIRAGSWFQSVLAVAFAKFASQRLRRASNLSYYGVEEEY